MASSDNVKEEVHWVFTITHLKSKIEIRLQFNVNFNIVLYKNTGLHKQNMMYPNYGGRTTPQNMNPNFFTRGVHSWFYDIIHFV